MNFKTSIKRDHSRKSASRVNHWQQQNEFFLLTSPFIAVEISVYGMRAQKISETGMDESVCACAIELRLVSIAALVQSMAFKNPSSAGGENGDPIMEPRSASHSADDPMIALYFSAAAKRFASA
jgi:hypothetical protein